MEIPLLESEGNTVSEIRNTVQDAMDKARQDIGGVVDKWDHKSPATVRQEMRRDMREAVRMRPVIRFIGESWDEMPGTDVQRVAYRHIVQRVGIMAGYGDENGRRAMIVGSTMAIGGEH